MAIPTLQNILYVEDEPDIQAVTKIALESIGGFTLEVCNSGQEALAKCENITPDLILLDVMMPEMDGPTTLSEIRKISGFEHIPVIFMTAKVQPQEIAHFKSIGAIEVIAKPFDPMTLSQTVNTIWSEYHDSEKSA